MSAAQGNGWAFTPATADKPAIWSGKNSIINPAYSLGRSNLGCGIPVFLIFALFAFLSGGDDPLGGFIGGLFTFGAVIGAGMILTGFILGKKFLGDDWELIGSADRLTLQGNENWSLALDEVARVESSATVEWKRTRNYYDLFYGRAHWLTKLNRKAENGGSQEPIPEHEFHVFMFTNDQRHLPIYFANANREDCQRLAHSIRSYIDAQRETPAPAQAGLPSAPENDGFDL